MIKDVIIIGKGPAGISAALYLHRAGFDIAVIGRDLGALAKSQKVENYYGMMPMDGAQIIKTGIEQAESMGIEVISDEITSIDKITDFELSGVKGKYQARAVLLATGKSRNSLKKEGFERLRGKGVSFCAICDGFFYRKKRLALIGSGNYALEELNQLKNFTKDIILFSDGKPLEADFSNAGIKIIESPIKALKGENIVEAILTENEQFPIDGAFIAIGTASAANFASKLGVLVNDDDIAVDDDFMTNIEGLYAAGDAIGGYLQVAKAVSDGAHAAKGMIKALRRK